MVGRIGRPHGLHGEVTVLPDTDDPARFERGATLTTDDGRELVVASSKPYRDRGLLVRFEGVIAREAAERLRGTELTIEVDDRRDLDEDEFWPEDLVGLTAVDPEGLEMGEVLRIEFGPGQDRLVIAHPTGEVQVPFVSEIVGDPEGDRIVIDAPEGLIPPV